MEQSVLHEQEKRRESQQREKQSSPINKVLMNLREKRLRQKMLSNQRHLAMQIQGP